MAERDLKLEFVSNVPGSCERYSRVLSHWGTQCGKQMPLLAQSLELYGWQIGDYPPNESASSLAPEIAAYTDR